jgi:hypothetical protein
LPQILSRHQVGVLQEKYKKLTKDLKHTLIINAYKSKISTSNNKMMFIYDGNPICKKALMTIYGIGKFQWESAVEKYRAKMKEEEDPLQSTPPTFTRNKTMSQKTKNALDWIANYVTTIGEQAPHKDVIYMPLHMSINQIYDYMLEDMPTKEKKEQISLQHFYAIWKANQSNVHFPGKSGRLGVCESCLKLGKSICEGEWQERLDSYALKKGHLNVVYGERSDLQLRKGKAAQYPNEILFIAIDAMVALHLPHFFPLPKSISCVQRIKWHCYGIQNYSSQTHHFNFVAGAYGGGPNTTTSLIFQHILWYFKTYQYRPPHLQIQFDNCWKENKNRTMLAFVGWLVKKKIFQDVELHCLPVGHTHEDVDQMFSNFTTKYHVHPLHSLGDPLGVIMHAAYNKQRPEVIIFFTPCISSKNFDTDFAALDSIDQHFVGLEILSSGPSHKFLSSHCRESIQN